MKKSLIVFVLVCASAVQFQFSNPVRAENLKLVHGPFLPEISYFFSPPSYPIISINGVDCAHQGEFLYYTATLSGTPGATPYIITWGASNGDTGSGYSFSTTMPMSGPLNVWVVFNNSNSPVQGAYSDKYTNQNTDCGGGTIQD